MSNYDEDSEGDRPLRWKELTKNYKECRRMLFESASFDGSEQVSL